MRPTRPCVLAALAAAACVSTSASAAELGFYVGFLYGDSSKQYALEEFDNLARSFYNFIDYQPSQRAFAKGKDGESYGFLAGYRLTQHLAFEGGYVYLGKQKYNEESSGVFIPGDGEDPIPETWGVNFTSKTSGFMLSALGVLPISYSWEAYARAGVLIASNTFDVFASNGQLAFRDDFNESSTDLLAGVGISVSLAEVYAIRAEYQRIFDAGHGDLGESDLDLITIGVTVSF
ncbi:MAG TPA: outer membrane beta-barrel protein [Steroidobacteraceae bacterium]